MFEKSIDVEVMMFRVDTMPSAFFGDGAVLGRLFNGDNVLAWFFDFDRSKDLAIDHE
jgi:hypothetical protein